MRRFAFIVCVACFMLSACGGGGGSSGGGNGAGSGSTSISVSTASVRMVGYRNFPSFQEQEISVIYRGAGVVVGTPPGQTLPSWLSVFEVSNTPGNPNQAVLRIMAVPHSLTRGTYTQTLRFVTGTANQTELKSADVVVTFEVGDVIDVGLVDDFPEFLEFDGDPAGPRAQNSAQIRITGDTAWRAVVNEPWASLSATSGTGARNLQVSVTRSGLPLGFRQAVVTVFDDVIGRRFDFAIDYTIRPARLSVSSGSLTINLNSQTLAADLSRALVVTDEMNGAAPAKGVSWSATIEDPWITLSATSGTSSPARTLTAQIGTRFANFIGSGTHETNINFAYVDSAGNPGTLQVPVTLQVRLPVARAVTPYFIAPNVASTVRVRGEDIRNEDLSALTIGSGVAGASIARVDATRLTLTLPPLPAGEYELRFANGAGLTRSGATVVVGAAPAVGAGVIESAHKKSLCFDAQRGRLFAVDRVQSEIEIHTWNGSAWVAGPTLSVPEVTDVALARSGRDLVITARHEIFIADANNLSAPWRSVWRQPQPAPNASSLNAIVLNDQDVGLLEQTSFYSGYQFNTVWSFDALTEIMNYETGGLGYLYNAQIAQSPGGRYAALGELGISVNILKVWDSFGSGPTLLGSVEDTVHGSALERAFDYDGTRFVEDSYFVRDVHANYLGKLGPLGEGIAHRFSVLSRNGARVFVHKADHSGNGGNGVIVVYDLAAAPVAELCPVIGTIPMPARILDPTENDAHFDGHPIYFVAGQLIGDGRFLLLAGPERTVVVDISGF